MTFRQASLTASTKATGIELNEHILLRIDMENRKAVGITLLDYSILVQEQTLTGLAKLSGDIRKIVMEILESQLAREVLSLSSETTALLHRK